MTAARQLPLTCSGHERPVVDVKFSDITENGYYLISASKDGKPMLRKGETGDWIGTFVGHKGAVWGATLNKKATMAATGAADFSAKLWDAVSGAEINSFAHKHIVKAVDFSQDGGKLLTASNEKKLRIFSIEKTNSDPTVMEGLTGNSRRCLWSSSNSVLNGGDDKEITQWDIRSLTVVNRLNVGSNITDMELSCDGQILTVTFGKTVAFYNPISFELLKKFELNSPIFSASLSPNKSFFVAGGEDCHLYKYDYETGNILESNKGHFGPIHCLEISPDGELYASGSEDGTLRLWQTTVGKTYGLWKSLDDDEKPSLIMNGDTVTEET
eukprot:gene12654-13954_t